MKEFSFHKNNTKWNETNRSRKESQDILVWWKVSQKVGVSHTDKNNFNLNPFAPEPPVTARADPGPFYPLWRHQF